MRRQRAMQVESSSQKEPQAALDLSFLYKRDSMWKLSEKKSAVLERARRFKVFLPHHLSPSRRSTVSTKVLAKVETSSALAPYLICRTVIARISCIPHMIRSLHLSEPSKSILYLKVGKYANDDTPWILISSKNLRPRLPSALVKTLHRIDKQWEPERERLDHAPFQ